MTVLLVNICSTTWNVPKTKRFQIFGRTRSTFHLGILESVYIKTRDPLLSRQREFVLALGLLKKLYWSPHCIVGVDWSFYMYQSLISIKGLD